MSADRPTLPPVRLPSDADLARAALAAPIFAWAVRLARWAGPETRVGAGGELIDEQLAAAAGQLGLDDEMSEGDGEAYASVAWSLAVDTGLVSVEDPMEETAGETVGDRARAEAGGGRVMAGPQLAVITTGTPEEVLTLWLDGLDVVFGDAIAPVLDDLTDAIGDDGEIDFDSLDWDPEEEADFLEGVLANLYLFTVAEDTPGPVPLPVLAASMVVPDDMGEPTDDILEQVSDAMMRLDDQFRLLEPIGVVSYVPVDETLMDEEEPAVGFQDSHDPSRPLDADDLSRYGMVTLTPLGLYGIRARMLEAGVEAPLVGDLAGAGARQLLDGIAYFPESSARAEIEQWLTDRAPATAAAELLAASHGTDEGAPLRRLHCQQALSLVGPEVEPAVREVLDDPELGGLARVWLVERGVADVPPPSESMVFWLSIDTIAAQLDVDGEPEDLQELVEGLTGQHSGFFETAWRVDHPATADVLEAMGRLHGDRAVAKEARKAAFKARSRNGS